ncbi:Ca2+-transporting ATPase [Methanolinea mesophila]|uniref:cation-translocating P-type ATPase n=1 Tax=Methanolinea mesophila TaxID=547055 RepID=UPI001AE4D90D|nr:cation-translocating P-type ATPase [Methanolinea mesophila]MBP1929200.1 Ca2+-transporting ATPase [Methanolinea mesophila]
MQVFEIDSVKGLPEHEAADRLRKEGYNELPAAKKRSVSRIILDVAREPMFILLVAAGSIYFILGDIQEGLILLSFVLVIIGITVYQEQKTERALDALRSLSSPRALVIRDGEHRRIPGREVVTGDMLILSEGDRVPADAVLLYSNNIAVDESLLTGESVPVRKVAWKEGIGEDRPGGDGLPWVWSGTMVVQGRGVAEVRSTGIRTEMGKIGMTLGEVERSDTHLKQEISGIVLTIALVGLALCILIVVVYGITRLNWIEGLLAGVTLAMAILPEEFPVVLTIFLALGAWRISRKNVLTRQIPAVEILGAATVLCVDKTGTLTENRMSVKKFSAGGVPCDFPSDSGGRVPESCHTLMEFGILASKKDPFDPMEKALKKIADGEFGTTDHVHRNWELVIEYPLSPELLAMSNVWMSPDGTDYVIAAKGAPEAVADLCHLDVSSMKDLTVQVDAMAAEGLRVLGVAKAAFTRTRLPANQHDFVFEFLGLIGFADPVRPDVPQAVRECYDAGIRVIMITGDYALTALNIARQIGLKDPEKCITGPELEELDGEALKARVGSANVFARTVPRQKLRIVDALKENGEVVAMTGDGVNDAPALKSADIGIAMGRRGTDVARESASLVLLDDAFSSIVAAVRLGRRIFDNLKKAVSYILSIHVPIAGMSLLPVLFDLPLVLLPVHIVFLELIIDPACSIVFEAEPEESDVMNRPPRKKTEVLFTRGAAFLSVIQGMVVLGIVLLVYSAALSGGLVATQARALAFTTIVISNLMLILTNRSWTRTLVSTMRTPNTSLAWVFAGTLVALFLVLYVPGLQDLFLFSPVPAMALAIAIGAGVASIIWFELFKYLKSRRLPAHLHDFIDD